MNDAMKTLPDVAEISKLDEVEQSIEVEVDNEEQIERDAKSL